jgi:hypothetical protein
MLKGAGRKYDLCHNPPPAFGVTIYIMRPLVMPLIIACVLIAPMALYATGPPKCTVCHSKRPAIRDMHKALEFRGCPACHAGGRGTMSVSGPREQDPLCIRCHKGG